jgi:hypothetical protein
VALLRGHCGGVGDGIAQAIDGLDEEARAGVGEQLVPQGAGLGIEIGEEGGEAAGGLWLR